MQHGISLVAERAAHQFRIPIRRNVAEAGRPRLVFVTGVPVHHRYAEETTGPQRVMFRPAAAGEVSNAHVLMPPADSPKTVMFRELPPKLAAFARTHFRATSRSASPNEPKIPSR